MFERLNEDEWDDEYTVKSLKEFLNSSYIDDDFPVRLGISEWNFSKSCNFHAKQITSFGKPFVCLESMEINNDYNEIYDKWIDKKIENNKLKKENKELRIQYNHIREQSNEFHRIARENANRVGQLEKENKELQYFKQRLSDLLDEKLEETMDNDEYMRRSILDFINELKKELGL